MPWPYQGLGIKPRVLSQMSRATANTPTMEMRNTHAAATRQEAAQASCQKSVSKVLILSTPSTRGSLTVLLALTRAPRLLVLCK